MAEELTRYSFHVRLEQLKTLRAVEVRDGVPVSEQIRRGIDLWLKAKMPQKPRPKKA